MTTSTRGASATSISFSHFACVICTLFFAVFIYGFWRYELVDLNPRAYLFTALSALGAIYFYKRATRNSTGASSEYTSKAIAEYDVVYKGGLPSYPSSKLSSIKFSVLPDSFKLEPTSGSSGWFQAMEIPFKEVFDLQIVQRQVNTAEAVLGGLDSRQLNQANNIHLSFTLGGTPLVLRLEMLSGFTVMGQAIKCQELEDRLRVNGIRQNFSVPHKQAAGNDIAGKIEVLRDLLSKGLINQVEFDKKKQEILTKF